MLFAVLVTAVLAIASMVGAPYPFEQRLQHGPTLLALIGLAVVAQKRWLSATSFFCVLGFWILHIIGARWIYSYVPYDEWFQWLVGRTLSELCGWERNHYDRFVHLAFGLLSVPPLAEALRRFADVNRWLAAGLAICVSLALGSCYEILEWWITLVFSPEQSEAYNGQQGDSWDAQKDMALAGLGAILGAGFSVGRKSIESDNLP